MVLRRSRRRRCLVPGLTPLVRAGGLVIALTLPTLTSAQTPPPALGPLGPPGGAVRPLPELPPAPPQRPEMELPRIPGPGENPPLSGAPTFQLKAIKFTGHTVISDEALQQVAVPYIGRTVTAADLESLRQRLTVAYVQKGYINSGAILPDQQVADGVVTYQIIEGRLGRIDVEGLDQLNPNYVADRLARGAGPPLNIRELERQQQILLQNPNIERLNVELLPGVRPGDARLHVLARETDPYSLSGYIANNQPPNVGAERGELDGGIRNIMGFGDQMLLRFAQTQGLSEGGFFYAVPVASDDTTISARFDIDNSRVSQSPFRVLDIANRTRTYALGVSRPLYQSPEDNFILGLSFEKRTSDSFLFGEPFSFSSGADNGATDVTVLRFYQDFLERTSEHVYALRSTFSFGLDAWDPTITSMRPTGKFTSWLGQAQYVQLVPWLNSQLLLRSSLQLSADPLFPIEQFSLGGSTTVRGYREAAFVRDDAFVGSAEYRVPVAQVRLPYVSVGDNDGSIQLAPFGDMGTGWNTGGPTQGPHNIESLGLG